MSSEYFAQDVGGVRMFRDTMALNMNPFGRSFPTSPESRTRLAFLTDLDRMPLRLDQCPDLLQPLFCKGILDLETHMARFHDLMTERGYVFEDDPVPSTDKAAHHASTRPTPARRDPRQLAEYHFRRHYAAGPLRAGGPCY
jgi:hypothetical protein